jgi:hypothetical protein
MMFRPPTPLLLAWATAALCSAAVAADKAPTPQSQGIDGRAQPAITEEESWTWFGMGYESRHRRRDGEGFSFGPERRPAGGFGEARGYGGSDALRHGGTAGHSGRGGLGNRGNASGRGR